MSEENKLARLDSSSIAELQEIANDVKKYVDTENDATLEMAMEKIGEKPNFFQRLFPTKFQKMQNDLTMRKMQSVYQAKERMFEIYTGIQLEIARQQGDALIAATGMHLQDQLTKFAAAKIDSMTDTLEGSMDSFMQKMYRQREKVDQYKKFPDLADRYEQSLKKEQETYFTFVEQLLENFKDTLNKKVKSLDSKN